MEKDPSQQREWQVPGFSMWPTVSAQKSAQRTLWLEQGQGGRDW